MSDGYVYYQIADVLGISLTKDNATGVITGDKEILVQVEGFNLPLKCKVESNHAAKDGTVYLLLKVKGNFSILVIANTRSLGLHYINIAKLDRLTDYPGQCKPEDVVTYLARIELAVVKSFLYQKKEWVAVAA